MKRTINCCKCVLDEDTREELIDLLGEFSDVLTSMADFTERLYDELADADDTCTVECDFDDEDEEDEEPEKPTCEDSNSRDEVDDFIEHLTKKFGDNCFEIGMEQVKHSSEPSILVMNALAGPMMLPASKVLNYVAENDKDIDIKQLDDNLYLCYNKTGVLTQDDNQVVTGPVFILKGKPKVIELTPMDVVQVFHEMDKRKESVRCTNGKSFPAFRL